MPYLFKDDEVQEPKFIKPEILQHPNIPKPLHGLNPRTILGRRWWDEKRNLAYKENNYCCWACGVHKNQAKYRRWLEAHEYYIYNYSKGRAKLKTIVALCHSCHNFIHSGRLKMLLDSGEISSEKYHDIMEHGMRILNENNLDYPWNLHNPKHVASWKKWHIVIEGKKYYTKFDSYEDWFNYYN
jgi:hypothetical protein